MSKYQVIFRLFGIGLVVSLSLMACFYIAERFFFDKLLYKKSVFHGYYNRRYYDAEKVPLNQFYQIIAQQREKDLNNLLTGTFWTKKPGITTIAVIGDSYTYGVGLLESERYPALLESELKKRGTAAKVYTFAEPGNSIMDYLALYQKIQRQLKPDIVVLGIVSNDLFFNIGRYPGDTKNLAAFDKVCPQPLYVNESDLTQDDAAFFKAAATTFDPQWRNRCYLVEAAKIFGQNPNIMYFNFSPKLSNIACNEQDKSDETLLMNNYISVLEKYGMRGLSHLTTDLSQQNFVSERETHPSRTENRDFAREISDFIVKDMK